MPLIDPDPVRPDPAWRALQPPSHYEHAVERAVERIRAGELEKAGAGAGGARPRAGAAIDPGAVFGALRDAFPACFCWCVARPSWPSSAPARAAGPPRRRARPDGRAGRHHAP